MIMSGFSASLSAFGAGFLSAILVESCAVLSAAALFSVFSSLAMPKKSVFKSFDQNGVLFSLRIPADLVDNLPAD